MLSTLRGLITILLVVAFFAVSDAYAAKTKPRKVCISSSGELLVKSKCTEGETLLSAAKLNQFINGSAKTVGPKGPEGIVGPQGPPGLQGDKGEQGQAGSKGIKGLIDFSGCRMITAQGNNIFIPANSGVFATATCDPENEFVFEDDVSQFIFPGSEGSKIFIQGRLTNTNTIVGDTREYEVTYYANRLVTVGQGMYILNVRVLCCPR